MFSAIMKGKSEIREDVITSSVFDNLLYLPDDLFWKILRMSCYNYYDLPINAGQILSYEFWPHWDNTDTDNEKYVEPDFFIMFENFDVVIEAKRENNYQEKEQWKKEIISYLNEYENSKKELFFIALDGIVNEEKEIIEVREKIIPVFKTRWTQILNVCTKLHNDLIINTFININHYKRIIESIIDYLAFYGFLKYTWLIELLEKEVTINNYKNTIEMLKVNSLDLDLVNNYNWLIEFELIPYSINFKNSINVIKKIWGIK